MEGSGKMAQDKYLSAAEKTVALTIASFTSYLDDLIELWTKINRPKDQIKYAKMAKSFGLKVLDFIMKDVNPDQVAKLVGGEVPLYSRGPGGALIKRTVKIDGELNKMQVIVKHKDEAAREYARMEKLDSLAHMEVGDLDKLIYFGMASCNLCELCGDDAKVCDMRQLFFKYDALPLNTDPGDGCPFRDH